MADRVPRVTGNEVVRALERMGWFVHRQRGSHVVLRKATGPGRVVVPVHRGRVLKPGTLGGILRQAGIDADEFRDYL